MADRSIFNSLKRLFSSDVIIRNVGGDQLRVMDVDGIQRNGVLQTNSLVDRFNRLYTTSNSYAYNYNIIQNYQALKFQLYTDYEGMDTDAIISSALDVLADECTIKNEQGEVLQIRSSDENIQKILYNLFYDVLNIEFNLWSWVRNMCKYGDFFLKLEIAEKFGVYNVIPFSAYSIIREEGVDPRNPSYVRFRFDPNAVASSTTTGYSPLYNQRQAGNEAIIFENYEMAHFRLLGDVNYLPYGRSYLEPARKTFKQMILMEDAMLIHRIVRAPEKRVFYVNVGSIPPNEVENYMNRMISKMKKTPYIDPQTGQYNLKYNIQNMLEDFFIPVRGNDQSTKIDTAKGLEYNGIEDVDYLRDKLFAALRIPKAFLGYEKDLTGKATLAAEDIRFARTVERVQNIIISELTKIALVHLYTQGYTNESLTNFSLSLTPPSIVYRQEMIALWKETVDLAASLQENNLLPTDWIYDNLFQFSEDKFDELRELLVADKKRAFRLKQIEEEGNDPLATGQAFGTPHQIASMYGGNANYTAAAGPVPQGYNELTDEPRPLPGRPSENPSIIGTEDDPLGRDRTGRADMNNNSKAGEDGSLKTNYQGGSALALEQTARVYLQNKSLLEGLKGRKVSLFENKVDEGLLDESNLKGDIE
jgi:hypothetical protein